MIKYYKDKEHNFFEVFNTKNGTYIRSGILDENEKDTGVDPFMRNFPALMQHLQPQAVMMVAEAHMKQTKAKA